MYPKKAEFLRSRGSHFYLCLNNNFVSTAHIVLFAGGLLSPCQQRALPSLSTAALVEYRCKKDGSYEEVQCQKNGLFCWCVDEDGNEIPGTRSRNPMRCPRRGNFKASFIHEFPIFSCF